MSRITVIDNTLNQKLPLPDFNHDCENLRKIANKTLGDLQSESGILIFPPKIEDTDDQIKDSVPQKGLKYHVNGNGKGVALIRLKGFEETSIPSGEGKIAIPVKVNEAGMELIENIENLSYVLFTIQGNEELKRYFRVIDIPRVLKKDSEDLNGFSLIRNTNEVKRFICAEIKETEPYNVQVPHDEQMVYIANAKKDIACYVELSP